MFRKRKIYYDIRGPAKNKGYYTWVVIDPKTEKSLALAPAMQYFSVIAAKQAMVELFGRAEYIRRAV